VSDDVEIDSAKASSERVQEVGPVHDQGPGEELGSA
jgi:hypothetical protein